MCPARDTGGVPQLESPGMDSNGKPGGLSGTGSLGDDSGKWSSPFQEETPDWAASFPPLPIPEEPRPRADISSIIKDRFGDMYIAPEMLQPLEELGQGGYAVVTKCSLIKANGKKECVAVKRPKRDFSGSQSDLANFFAEVQLLGSLQHPSIVGFKGVCVGVPGGGLGESECICLVQEYLNGGSLKDLVMQQYMRPTKRAYSKRQGLMWLLEVAQGLEYLHGLSNTVIHRDLKLENILLHRDSLTGKTVAKITDFGLGAMVRNPKLKGRGMSQDSSMNRMGLVKRMSGGFKRLGSNLMKQFSTIGEALDASQDSGWASGKLMKRLSRNFSKDISDPAVHNLSGRTGSLLYMAPEVIMCRKYNEKVDVFSFAVCMYEVMCGAWLLMKVLGSSSDPSKDVEKYAQNVAKGFRNPVSAFWPQPLKMLVEDCWAHDSNERPTTKDVTQRLQEMLDSGMYSEEEGDTDVPKCCTMQ